MTLFESSVPSNAPPPPQIGAHLCHANDCTERVPPRMLMCKRHWYMVPKPLRDAVWDNYVPGQERRKDPTAAYLSAAQAAIDAVARKEGRRG